MLGDIKNHESIDLDLWLELVINEGLISDKELSTLIESFSNTPEAA